MPLSWFFTPEGLGKQAQIHVDIQGYGGSDSNIWFDLYETQNPRYENPIPQQNGTEDTNLVVDLDPPSHYFTDDHDTGSMVYSVVNYDMSFLQSATLTGDTLTLVPVANKYGDTEITVQARDTAGLTETGKFIAHFEPLNDPPTSLSIGNTSIDENKPFGSIIGMFSTLDPDLSDTHTYTLVAGSGSADNGAFTISGNALLAGSTFDFEAKSSYSIRVRSTDSGGLFTDSALTISVNDINEAPTNIGLAPNHINENQPLGTVVGNLSTTDPDLHGSHTYTLVDLVHFPDNSAFVIDGNLIRTGQAFDFESKNSYTIMVKSTDDGGLGTEKQFIISIDNINDPPGTIHLSHSNVGENLPAGALVGNLTAEDQDSGDTHTFALIDDAHFPDNAAFRINGGTLETARTLDFEAQSTYLIKVQATDSHGATNLTTFSITVDDVNEAPVLHLGLGPALQNIDEDSAANAGTLIVDLVASATGNLITDQDGGALEGIAITGTDTSHGHWQYTTDGTNWLDVGAVRDDAALLLAADGATRVRFVPNEDYNGALSDAITFRAWDRTFGSNGQPGQDVSVNGGRTAFSSAFETADIMVEAVNDPPVIQLPADEQSTPEGNPIEFSIANANAIQVSDADAAAGTGELQVHLSVTEGKLALKHTAGLVFNAGADGTADMIFTGLADDINHALDGMTFTPLPNYSGTVTINITADDLGNTGKPGAFDTAGTFDISVLELPGPPVPTDSDSLIDQLEQPGEPDTDMFSFTTMPDEFGKLLWTLHLTDSFPSYGSTLETANPEVKKFVTDLYQALFAETNKERKTAWEGLIDFAEEKAASSDSDEYLDLKKSIKDLRKWRHGMSSEDVRLVFNADDIQLAEWFRAVVEWGNTNDHHGVGSDTLGSGPTSLWGGGTSLAFNIDELRIADVLMLPDTNRPAALDGSWWARMEGAFLPFDTSRFSSASARSV